MGGYVSSGLNLLILFAEFELKRVPQSRNARLFENPTGILHLGHAARRSAASCIPRVNSIRARCQNISGLFTPHLLNTCHFEYTASSLPLLTFGSPSSPLKYSTWTQGSPNLEASSVSQTYKTMYQLRRFATSMYRWAKNDAAGELSKGLAGPTVNSKKPSKSKRKAWLVSQWKTYIQKGTLEDFQRLCADLNLSGDLDTKTKCRKVC